jgi:hypothetical protein
MANTWNVDTATEWGIKQGLLKPGEKATGGLLTQRAQQTGQKAALDMAVANAGAVTDPTALKNIRQAYQTSQAPKPVTQVMSEQVQNPSIPSQAIQGYTPQEITPDQLMTGQGTQIQGVQLAAPEQVEQVQMGPAAQAQAYTVDEQGVLNIFNPETGQYEAMTITEETPQAVAQQGEVSREATVKGQLEDLYAEAQPGEVPAWARGAVTNANDVMAARGLANSSIGSQAIAAAIQQSALPIASQDATTYFQMDIRNLENRQQTELQNTQLRQQALLTDAAAQNAAAQFNAQSENQTQQFMASLVSQIKEQNAARMSAISQVNAASDNRFKELEANLNVGVNQFNTQIKEQIKAFNGQVELQRQQFNATNAFAIEQSNVLWRRGINTANTAGFNAANQANAQNAFNLSANALNNIWQQLRDDEAWLNTAVENQKDRDFQYAYLANQQKFAESVNEADITQYLGAAAKYALRAAPAVIGSTAAETTEE